MASFANRSAWLGSLVFAALAATSAFAQDRGVNVFEGASELKAPAPPGPSTEPSGLRTDNKAGVRLSIHPGTILPLGTNVTFDVATVKAGYLLLVDINAERQVTQIYPNIDSLVRTNTGKTLLTNLIQPGTVLSVPNLKNPLAQFEFKADRPIGRGVIVAILSEQPVQVIDLPELPSSVSGSQESVDFLDKSIRGLMVAEASKPGDFRSNNWSLVATEYIIK